jgi:uncharacterized integral membrane protein
MVIVALLSLAVGSLLTIFTLQNAEMASITLFAWHLNAPMAFLLVGVLTISVFATIASVWPLLTRLEKRAKKLEDEKKALQDELAKYSITIPIAPPAVDAASLLLARERQPVHLPR